MCKLFDEANPEKESGFLSTCRIVGGLKDCFERILSIENSEGIFNEKILH